MIDGKTHGTWYNDVVKDFMSRKQKKTGAVIALANVLREAGEGPGIIGNIHWKSMLERTSPRLRQATPNRQSTNSRRSVGRKRQAWHEQ